MTTESQPLIDCRNVRKIFPDSAGVPFAAVDDVSFRLSAGEIVGLLGPDGAGKTTLIRLITGLMKPHGGSISVLNLDSVKKSRSIQASIGYMPQKFGLYEDLTVRENMELYARMHGVYGQDREKRFRSLLAMTSLERFTTRLAGKLSGGMKQKLGLCCSLVSSPPLILLDEPTVGVDPLSRRELWSILKQFSGEEGVGVLVSTSYMDESAYCNRTLIMYEGRLLMDAPPADVIARAEGMCVTVRTPEGLHARQFQSRLAAVPGIINATPQGNTVRIIVPHGHPARKKLEEYHPAPAQPDFSDGFMTLLADQVDLAPQDIPAPAGTPEPERTENGGTVIRVTDLVRKFGSFIAVNHVSFSVRKGQVFGLLGPNGSGKTTMIKLLMRFYDVDAGAITLNGRNVRDFDRSALREGFGMVLQDTWLFQGTIMENIRYGRLDATDEEVIAAAKAACADHFIRTLPGGYQMELNEDASNVSQGQKQLLTIARAILADNKILILDEATSSVDTRTEQRIQTAMDNLMRGRTSFVIAHRLSTIKDADLILVMRDGDIVEQGTHDDLLAAGGFYADLYNSQFEDVSA